jgi:subtilisin family serine protease
LTILSTENLSALGTIAYQFQFGPGQDLRDVIRAIANFGIHAGIQPNYSYTLAQQPDPQSLPPAQSPIGDPSQYVLGKLKIVETHRIARGTNVLVAVIDSEIDARHPDLAAAIANRFNATGVDEPPHTHGTGMAGAIVAQKRLLGTAPGARILAIRAFSTRAATAESTTLQILKGLDYAIKSGVRVINMSFAGPRDPSLSRQLKVAYDKGIVLIAAAGNAGPGSPPLFPAADESVIAVTATDVNDMIFSGANRGNHIAVAAPGVDILVPAPGDAYQMTTGTSVATAHVSGIVALMLERNPSLTPADVRRILTGSAHKLGPGARNDDFGYGLVDPLRALQAVPVQVVQPQAQPQRAAPANVPTPVPRRRR